MQVGCCPSGVVVAGSACPASEPITDSVQVLAESLAALEVM
jgi:hypothetical protein